MILAGDVGGTKTNLGLFAITRNRPVASVLRRYASAEYSGLELLVRDFLAQTKEKVTTACFGVPCPVIKGKCETPNLPWSIDLDTLKDALQISMVSLINDLESAAYGISVVDPSELTVVNEGRPNKTGNSALLAAGTGLGEAILFWNGERRVPSASEGGHSDFAPHNALEVELFQYLQAKFGHVSWERVLSGPGLFNIYSFLRDAGYGQEPTWLAERLAQGDPAAAISQAAQAGECDLCGKALDLFVSLYGAEAGNLALKAMATAGVYIGGGIAPKIISKLLEAPFMTAFTEKGRLAPLMANIPVKVIVNDQAPLYGAASYAFLVQQSQTDGKHRTSL